MKKKLKTFVGLVAVLILGTAIVTPRMLESSIPSIYYITPSMKNYENIVNCSGTIQAAQVRAIYVEAPLVASEIYAGIGDLVEAGDPLAKVDMTKTGALTSQSLEMLKDFSSDSVSDQVPSVDWASLASMYGLSTVVNGGSGTVDYSQLEGLLDGGAASNSVRVPVSPGITETITAPISGIVTDIGIKEDVPVGAGKAIFTLTDTGEFKVMATVSEGDIAKIKEGDKAKIRGVAFSGKVYNGVVVKVYPTARKMLSGTTTETVVDVEIQLNNADDRLKPGFSAKVEISGDEDYSLLTVPYEAIRQDENNNEYVYIYEEGHVKKAMVVTGQEMTNEVQVLSGLKEDSIVVFNPGSMIKEGGMIYIKGRADGN